MPALIRLRAETTKSKRADTLGLHPQIADGLRAYRPEDVASSTPVLSAVPSMKVMKADLKFAGIEYGDQTTGFADLHAMRKSLSTMMAAAGMTQRARQAHMRHTDPRLTDVTYMDERLLPIASELSKLPSIPDAVSDEDLTEAIQFRATGTDDSAPESAAEAVPAVGPTSSPENRAANMQQTGCVSGHFESPDGTTTRAGWSQSGQDEAVEQTLEKQGNVSKRQRLSPSGNRRSEKAGEEIRTLDIHVGNA